MTPDEDEKYEITDIAHPDNPKLHRIRALTDVGTDVHKGDFGGFVETEDNLDQEGFAWIGKDAIACEDSYIGGDAILADSAVARTPPMSETTRLSLTMP